MKPSLDDLTLLASVIRRRSFRRAAADHGLSPSSLSERIRGLEDQMGVRLLNRTTRSVSPTEAGEALMTRIGGALDDIAQAVAAAGLPAGAVVGRLRINAPAAADTALGPLIAPFLEAHPGVQMEIVVDNAFTDVIGEGFDAGVRYGERLARDMIAAPLGGRERFVLVAAPSLLERVGTPASPLDLARLPCLRVRLPGGVITWEFEKDGRVIRVQPQGPLTVTDASLARQAALDGLGFHAVFEALGPGRSRRRAAGEPVRGLAAAVRRAVPLLSVTPACAARPRRLRRLPAGPQPTRSGRRQSAGIRPALTAIRPISPLTIRSTAVPSR